MALTPTEDPYKRAVQDYKNSVDVQNSLANYHATLKNVNEVYPKIVKDITSLFGPDATKKIVDGQRLVANVVVDQKLKAEEAANARLERDLRKLESKQDAIYDRERANTKLENYRLSLLQRKDNERHKLRQEIDNKSKLVYLNQEAFTDKLLTVGKLQTTLLFLTLIAFISYGQFMGISSANATAWMLGLAIVAYIVTMIRKFYWKDLLRAEFEVLDYLAPNYAARMCPSGC